MKNDDKVTSMTKKGEKVLHESPRGDDGIENENKQELKTPAAGTGKEISGTQESVLRRESKYMNTQKGNKDLTSTRKPASGRRIRFEDEDIAPSDSDVSASSQGYSKVEQIDDDEGDVEYFGQELLQPGERGPPHLRELDILF